MSRLRCHPETEHLKLDPVADKSTAYEFGSHLELGKDENGRLEFSVMDRNDGVVVDGKIRRAMI